MIPIETVVDLLMQNAGVNIMGDGYVRLGEATIVAKTRQELGNKIKAYLSTLSPKPKLLSECEEGKPCVRVNRYGEWGVVVREGMSAYSMHDKPALRQLIDKDANRVKVIQPVEVT